MPSPGPCIRALSQATSGACLLLISSRPERSVTDDGGPPTWFHQLLSFQGGPPHLNAVVRPQNDVMKSWKRGTLVVALLFGVAWLLTGGLVVHTYWVNPFRSSDKEFKPYILAEVKCPAATYGIPFVYEYHGDRLPFSIFLTYISHNVVEEPRIEFERLTIRFPDGTEADLGDRFRGGLVPRAEEHWYIDDLHVHQNKPSLRSEVTLEDCVPTRTAFTLRIKGKLLSRGATIETFEADWGFTPSYDTHTFSTWYWILLSGA